MRIEANCGSSFKKTGIHKGAATVRAGHAVLAAAMMTAMGTL